MQRLASLDALLVRQSREWGEILSGFETRNRYVVTDRRGEPLYYAAEEGGSTLLRLALKAARPFTLAVLDPEGRRVLTVERPFRLLFHEATVRDASGRALGRVRWRFALLRRRYAVEDAAGMERFSLHGPFLKPWTFWIREGDRERGRIAKRWSGLGRELFSDADRFGLEIPAEWPVEQKALFLGLVFFVDFRHFESRE